MVVTPPYLERDNVLSAQRKSGYSISIRKSDREPIMAYSLQLFTSPIPPSPRIFPVRSVSGPQRIVVDPCHRRPLLRFVGAHVNA